jgi:hypothetical protein
MCKILPNKVKKPPVIGAYQVTSVSSVYISFYNYYINNILVIWLFIYMCWRKTCSALSWNREHGKQPDNPKIKGGRLAQTMFEYRQLMVCHLHINFKGFIY